MTQKYFSKSLSILGVSTLFVSLGAPSAFAEPTHSTQEVQESFYSQKLSVSSGEVENISGTVSLSAESVDPIALNYPKLSEASRTAQTAPEQRVDGSKIVSDAKQFLGVPYVWGGTTPDGFDCSGLTQYVYAMSGIHLPRVDTDQHNFGTEISASDARPGDLVWHPGHIGIYIGNGQIIHAPRPGKTVTVAPLSDFNSVTFVRI
jgi:cell wall-associated NlpC family hydrolase